MSEKWTTDRIPDLHGKIIIVTGANSGIGYAAAQAFAHKGAQTILACRNMDKAQAALDRIRDDTPGAMVEAMHLDLADLRSIHAFAEGFTAKAARLDILVNNAGIMWPPYQVTRDGFESQFGTNHLGHFALTGLLLPWMLRTPGARVVNVSSIGHRSGTLDFANLMFENGTGYTRHRAYARSKLANLLFTYELQRRLEAAGADTLALAAHPGLSNTNLLRHRVKNQRMKTLYPIAGKLLQDADMGALPTLRAAVDPGARGGDYYGPGGFMESRGYPVRVQSNPASHKLDDARRLWDISEQLTGVRFVV